MPDTYTQIANNMRACGIREDWCAAVEAGDALLQALEWSAEFIPENKGDCRETVRAAIAKAKGEQ